MDVEIRPARPVEAAALTDLAHAAKRHWDYPEAWIERWADTLTITAAEIEEQTVRCAVANDAIVGFYAIAGVPGDAELTHLWVVPEHHREGVGSRLLDDALATAASMDIDELSIAADPNAAGFYEARGATLVAEVPSTPEGRTIPVLVIETG